MIYSWEIAAKL